MKYIPIIVYCILFSVLLVNCRPPASVLPTATPTPVRRIKGMIEPGDKIGDMVVTFGLNYNVKSIWDYCDPVGNHLECEVPPMSKLFIGQGSWSRTTQDMEEEWKSSKCELILDGQPLDLPAFGTHDYIVDMDGSAYFRMVNVVLEQPTLGTHTLRWVVHHAETNELWADLTWTFSVIGKTTFPTITSVVSPGQQAHTSQAGDVNFLLYLPDEYGKVPQKVWPLIMYLHGSGERGYGLKALKKQPLPETLEQQTDFPFIVVSPQLAPEQSSWANMIDPLNTLLDEIQGVLPVDPHRIYLTGISLGGAGTWGFGSRFPRRFAALVPIAGFYDHFGGIPDNICDLKDVPIWVFHGDKDGDVPASSSKVLVDALKACGGNVRFTLYPDANHEGAWRKAYADPELYTWLSAQTLR